MKLRKEQVDALAVPSPVLRRELRDFLVSVGRNATFDTAGDLLIPDEDQGTTQMGFDRRGRPNSIVGPDGRAHSIEYANDGRVAAIGNTAGQKTQFRFDDSGGLVEVVDPSGYAQQVVHHRGVPVGIIRPGASGVTVRHDPAGNPAVMIDGRGNALRFQFDSMNRLTRFTTRAGARSRFAYDDEDRLVSMITPGNQTWAIRHIDGRSEKVIVHPDGKPETYQFAGSELRRVIRRDGTQVSFEWQSDQPVFVRYPDDLTVRLVRDNDGRVKVADNGHHKVLFEYDQMGRRTAEQVDGSRVEARFTDTGLLGQLITHRGETVSYEYGDDQRVSRITMGQRSFKITREARGFITGLQFPNGIRSQRAFSAIGTLSDEELFVNRVVITRSYKYDENDLLTGVTDTVFGTKTHQFDADDRLVEVRSQHRGERYAYDAHGNAVEMGGRRLTYDELDRVATGTDLQCRYDDRGNLTEWRQGTGSSTRFHFNGQNQLIRADLPDGRTAAYEYDAFGRRLLKRIDDVTTTYTWWGEQIIGEDIQEGDRRRRITYLYVPGTHTPLAMCDNGSFYYYQTDHLDTPIRLMDESGTIVWSAEPHGFQFHQFESRFRQPLRFPGQFFDEETGLHYNLARYYSPIIGRYLSPDPLFLENATNFYLYAANNPVNLIDPSGRILPVLLVAAGIVAGAVVAGAVVGSLFAGVHQVVTNLVNDRPVLEGVGSAVAHGAISGAGAGLGAGIGFLVGGPAGAVVGGILAGTATSGIMAAVEAPEGHGWEACKEAVVGSVPFIGSIERYRRGDPTVKNPKSQLLADLSFDLLGTALIFLGARRAAGRMGGYWKRPVLNRGAAVARGAAQSEASRAQGVTPGRLRPQMAGAMELDGETYQASSVRGENPPALNPAVQQVLDSIPENERGRGHGRCAEPQLISQALDQGKDPRGGTISTVLVKPEGNAQHGQPTQPCASCRVVMDKFGVRSSDTTPPLGAGGLSEDTRKEDGNGNQ